MNPTQIRDQAKQYIDQLPLESLQFVNDFLSYLLQKSTLESNTVSSKDEEISALDLAGDIVGYVEGPEDLATNKDYFQGFGE
ncbi:hypothetical protein [Picosynechococcus sp. PCC 73109]|uniref:hypothetical protein n=1 Tax=Picosynechococcus sp. PCC 73109 TaxID=374982 RepID=UPI0007457D3D|nr:hypothetical protein [Picosynechococcus sp. PCC 73109]AMA08818.1 hypothetical protein AWQ23_05525 [Picosynechococcus sp. PCC 73109]